MGARIGLRDALKITLDAIPSLMLLVIVIGGIIGGFFTATEASVVAVVYSLVLSFIYKQMKCGDIPELLFNDKDNCDCASSDCNRYRSIVDYVV